ncbi:MAG: right-handed parallel beta-helix repeat-containing protein [Planctomycetota bacterium]
MYRELTCWICFAIAVSLVAHASAGIPDGWSNRDIGTTGGSANEAGGTWTVSGDGADVWGASDAFHYAYIPLSGNGQITARVVSHGTGSHRWSKGGVMIRETLARGSKHAIMAITGGEGGGLTFQNRPTTGGRSFSAHSNITAAPPHWVRLKREGDTITGYSSADGVDWVQQPDGTGANATANPVDIPMAGSVFVGLFVTSHATGEVRTYIFDNVTVESMVIASEPEPADAAVCLETWANLSWTPGPTAVSHDVYFGESFAAVNDGTGGTFRGNQPSTSFSVGFPGFPYPDGLAAGTTYYWRVDEFDGAVTHKGDVWSFTAMSADVLERPPSAVPTFHCIGVYWSPQDGSGDDVCQVHYRRVDSTEWKEAMALWYDDRGVGGYPEGYRGSIVNLDPGTAYEIKLELLNTGTEEQLTAETWSEDFPIAKTVYLPSWTTYHTLRITESGSPDGYILYKAPAGGGAIDVRHLEDYCITVDASYIIIRGLDLKGAKKHGIRLYNCHDVVIEECDISDWSTIEDDGWGNRGSAIFSDSRRLERIIVQRNKMHHPHSDTNSWSENRDKYGSAHPRGPRAVCYVHSAGNHVIRYNEIYSDDDHYFADCMTAGNNNFPNRDSDIYGNYVANCWDDGIEAEDDNCNVRIWGNFIEWTFVKIAVASTKVGPIYIWRNVAGVGQQDDIHPWNDVVRGGFLKTNNNGGGKIYVFHNTLLQPEQPRGVQYPLGCGRGLGWGGPMQNTMSRNNILHIHKPGAPSIKDRNYDPLGDYDYDLYNGYIDAYPGAEPNGIRDVPIYDRNNGDGQFALDPFSPGYDAGVVIANFNDNYNGAAPDIGAHEAGSPPMEFGIDAYQ